MVRQFRMDSRVTLQEFSTKKDMADMGGQATGHSKYLILRTESNTCQLNAAVLRTASANAKFVQCAALVFSVFVTMPSTNWDTKTKPNKTVFETLTDISQGAWRLMRRTR